MRTVLLTAAGTLCLVFAAHAAEAPRLVRAHDGAAPIGAAQAARPAHGDRCVDTRASLRHAAYMPGAGDLWGAGSQNCPQFLSTQTLVQSPSQGHT